mmetsp:Transcript_22350/g.43448  ORF Transcript_22350/g.43448 Transcript_22350/m.43448 type:complete len:112 (+) Transcript_22350:1-336(+)
MMMMMMMMLAINEEGMFKKLSRMMKDDDEHSSFDFGWIFCLNMHLHTQKNEMNECTHQSINQMNGIDPWISQSTTSMQNINRTHTIQTIYVSKNGLFTIEMDRPDSPDHRF